MKRILLSLTILCIGAVLFAQAPQSFKYQTVVRDAADEILDNQQVYFRISILQYSDVGTEVYTETFDRTTNDFGLVTFNIGEGDVVETGVFEDIDWSDGPYYVKVEVDIDGPGGTYNYEETGTSELLSVPYALHSQTTEDLGDEMDYIEEFLYSGGLLKDYDGNVYNTVLIGEQVWMAENLRVTHYADGTPIPLVTDVTEWEALTMEDRAYTFLSNDPGNADPWGAFYTWSTVTDGVSSNTNPSNVQGVCPDGWHVPSDAEWQELELYLGMSPADTSLTGSLGTDEGGKLKATGYDYFISPNTGATNETGFTGIAAGNRTFTLPGFDNHKKYGVYWTSRKGTGDNAKTHMLYYNKATIGRNDNENRSGFSCRCVKDDIDETSYGSINMGSPDNDLSGRGIVTEGTIDANDTGFGAALYIASDGNYKEAAADAAATMPCVALALERGTGSKRIMLQGFLSNDDWTWTPGGLIYVSPNTPGALTQTIPSTSGQQVQIVGYATSANTIYFDPNLMLIEIE